MFSIKLHEDTNRIPSIPKAVESAVDRVVRKTAFDIEGSAKIRVPVDTGTARASIHTIHSYGSGHAQAVANSVPGVSFHADESLPPIGTAIVAVAVEYGLYIELGTSGSGPRPFLEPSVSDHAVTFRSAIAQAVRNSIR